MHFCTAMFHICCASDLGAVFLIRQIRKNNYLTLWHNCWAFDFYLNSKYCVYVQQKLSGLQYRALRYANVSSLVVRASIVYYSSNPSRIRNSRQYTICTILWVVSKMVFLGTDLWQT